MYYAIFETVYYIVYYAKRLQFTILYSPVLCYTIKGVICEILLPNAYYIVNIIHKPTK